MIFMLLSFAECKIAFAVCLEHTAKKLIPVVRLETMLFFAPTLYFRLLEN
jgi:hypothetical protein